MAGIRPSDWRADPGLGAAPRCEVCGNEYDKCFEVTVGGQSHTLDCFECAIHLLAPVCAHCGCRVVGHGVEVDGTYYCCAHCAREATGLVQLHDRAERPTTSAG